MVKKKQYNINNNLLAAILGVTVLVSLAGTFFTVSYLDQVTGAATSTGIVNLSITTAAACVTTDDNAIDFSTLAQGANAYSENSTIADWILLNNSGNVYLNVSVYVADAGDLFQADSSPTEAFQAKCNSTITNDCENTSYAPIQAAQEIANLLVSNLSSLPDQNQMSIGINVTVPGAEPAGSKGATLTFECLDSIG